MCDLPIINMEQPDVPTIIKACREFGFFMLENHGIPQEKIHHVFQQSEALFALPLAHKMALSAKEKTRGYRPLYDQTVDRVNQKKPDTKEAFIINFEREQTDENSDLSMGPNIWPSEQLILGWKETMQDYYSAVQDVGLNVLRIIAEGLDLEPDFFARRHTNVMGKLELIRYTSEISTPDDGIFGVGAHTDYGMMTLLLTDDVPGLQVLVDGKWQDVPPRPGTYICNIGDMTQRWTNDYLKSARHRVVNKLGRVRYSIPFFMDPDNEAEVACFPQFCSKEKPAKYAPTTFGKYLLETFKATLEEESNQSKDNNK